MPRNLNEIRQSEAGVRPPQPSGDELARPKPDAQMAGLDFEMWLEFELWQQPWDPGCDAANVKVSLADGRRYALNVWTFSFLERARARAIQAGENLDGKYLDAPDLFVHRLEGSALQATFSDLLRKGGLDPAWEISGAESTG